MELFCKGNGMELNVINSTLFSLNAVEAQKNVWAHFCPFKMGNLEDGVNYLGFKLKLNKYGKADWVSLVTRVDKMINCWCNR